MPEQYMPESWVCFADRWFPNAVAAACQLRYEARLIAANAKQVRRYGPMHCASMRREASRLYAGARAARAARADVMLTTIDREGGAQ